MRIGQNEVRPTLPDFEGTICQIGARQSGRFRIHDGQGWLRNNFDAILGASSVKFASGFVGIHSGSDFASGHKTSFQVDFSFA
jgi:hypothetical protein